MKSSRLHILMCHKLTPTTLKCEHSWLHRWDNCQRSLLKVTSSTVADALTTLNDDKTTRLFIRLFAQFFDCLDVASKMEGILKRKEYTTRKGDHRFKVLLCACIIIDSVCTKVARTFLTYWEKEVLSIDIEKRNGTLLSKETREGLHSTGIYIAIEQWKERCDVLLTYTQQFLPFLS